MPTCRLKPRLISIEELEAMRMESEVRQILSIGHGWEGMGSACALARGPVRPNCRPGYKPAGNGIQRVAYLQLH
jgi:hypothetical protein